MGIEVLPPDVNESRAHFTVVDEKTIRFGLTAVKGIGISQVREIIAVRGKEGKFLNIENFAMRIPAKILNKKSIESLALSGTMDSLGERAQLAENYEEISTFGKNLQASHSEGQTDIFGMMEDDSTTNLKLKKIPPASHSQRLKWEKQYLGLYVSGHPLAGMRNYFKAKGRLIADFTPKMLGKNSKINGIVTNVKKINTKTGKYMCMGEIEDPSGRIQFVLFPGAYDRHGQAVEEEKVFSFEGKLDKRGNDLQFVVNEVKILGLEAMINKAKELGNFDNEDKIIGVPAFKFEDEEEEELLDDENEEKNENHETANTVYVIDLDENADILPNLKPFLEANKGNTKAEIHIRENDKIKRIRVPFGIRVDSDFEEGVKKLLLR